MRELSMGGVLLRFVLCWILCLDVCMSGLREATWEVLLGSGCGGTEISVTCPADELVVVRSAQENVTCLQGSPQCRDCREEGTDRRRRLAGLCDTRASCVIPVVPCPRCTIMTARTEYTCLPKHRFYNMCGPRKRIADVNWGLLSSDMFPALITTSQCHMVLAVPEWWRVVVRPLYVEMDGYVRIDVCSWNRTRFQCSPPGNIEHMNDVTIHVTDNTNTPDTTRFLLEFEMYEHTVRTTQRSTTPAATTSATTTTAAPTATPKPPPAITPRPNAPSTTLDTVLRASRTRGTAVGTITPNVPSISPDTSLRASSSTRVAPGTAVPGENGSAVTSRTVGGVNDTSRTTNDTSRTTTDLTTNTKSSIPSTTVTTTTTTTSTTISTTTIATKTTTAPATPRAVPPLNITAIPSSTANSIVHLLETESTTGRSMNGLGGTTNEGEIAALSVNSSLERSDYIIIGLVVFIAIIIISVVIIVVVVYRRSKDSALRRVVVVLVREPTKRLSQLSKLFRMSDIDRQGRYSGSPEENNSKHSSNVISLHPVLVESSSQTSGVLRRLNQLGFLGRDSSGSERYDRPQAPPVPKRELRDSEVVIEGAVGGREEGKGAEPPIDRTKPIPPPSRKQLTIPPTVEPAFVGPRAGDRRSSAWDPMYERVGTLPPPLMPRSRPTTPPPQVHVTPPTPDAGKGEALDLTFPRKVDKTPVVRQTALLDDPSYDSVDPMPSTSSGSQGEPHFTSPGGRKPSIGYPSDDVTIVENDSYGEMEFT